MDGWWNEMEAVVKLQE